MTFDARTYDVPQRAAFRTLVEDHGFSLRSSRRDSFAALTEVVASGRLIFSQTSHNGDTFRCWKIETTAEHWDGPLSRLMELAGQTSTETDSDFITLAEFLTKDVNDRRQIDDAQINEIVCRAKAAYLAEGNRLS
jgi:hypothetical protein